MHIVYGPSLIHFLLLIASKQIEADLERELKAAQSENFKYQHDLQDKINQLRDIHMHLDDYRNVERDEKLELMADNFWKTNINVLYSAYTRFRAGVLRRINMGKKYNKIRKVYQKAMKSFCWSMWLQYRSRCNFAKASVARRKREALCARFNVWKLYTGLEKHFKHVQQKLRLSKVFRAWSSISKEQKWLKNTDESIAIFQLKHVKRTFFNNWKSTCVFLDWRHKRIVALERQGLLHFKSTLFRAWHYVAVNTRAHNTQLISQLSLVRVKRPLQGWIWLCRSMWRRRAQLFRLFFRNMKKLLFRKRNAVDVLDSNRAFLSRLFKKRMLKKWVKLVHFRARKHLLMKTSRHKLVSYYNKKLLRTSYLYFSYATSTSRRQHACSRLAAQSRRHKTLLWTLKTWNMHVVWAVEYRKRKQKQLLRVIFDAWALYVPMSKRETFLKLAVESRYNKTITALRRYYFNKWRVTSRKRARLQYCFGLVSRRSVKCEVRRAMVTWRCRWSKSLYWREKEIQLENMRKSALNELKEQELKELEREKERVELTRKDLESNLVNMQSLITKRETQLRELTSQIEQQTLENESLEKSLEASKVELKLALEEKERLKSVEQLLEEAKKRENNFLVARKNEADALLRKLKAENKALQEEALQAREQLLLVERTGQYELENEKVKLQESLDKSTRMKEILYERQQLEASLTKENNDIEAELVKLQAKVEDVTQCGVDTLADSEKEIRVHTSELNVLNSNMSITEARVNELRRLIAEKRQDLASSKYKSILREEQKELMELNKLEDECISAVSGGGSSGNVSVDSNHSATFSRTLNSSSKAKSLLNNSTKRGKSPSLLYKSVSTSPPAHFNDSLTVGAGLDIGDLKLDNENDDDSDKDYQDARQLVRRLRDRLKRPIV